jgi:hypothetical protein
MKERTIIIFSLFVALVIVFVIFVYVSHNATNNVVEAYSDEIASCATITDEKVCYENERCEGVYAKSCENCQNLEFKKCQTVSEVFVEQYKNDKELCEKTSGQWYRNKLGNFCLCEKAGLGKIFDKIQGCIEK